MTPASLFTNEMRHALNSEWPDPQDAGTASIPSALAVTDLATSSICAAASEVAVLAELPGPVTAERTLASQWFKSTIEPIDFELAPVWDSIAGDYQTADGWIRLHTNAPHHKAAAVAVLDAGHDPARSLVAAQVVNWAAGELETAVVEADGCAAELHSTRAWAEHPQGRAVSAEKLIEWSGESHVWTPSSKERPLNGLRVLDLTRILAGPVATRFLAGWGAEVLRIDPLDWDEPVLAPEVTLGKRCTRLDLRSTSGSRRFHQLLGEADVIVHGYRPDALAGLGLGPFDGVVDVALDAYGWTGPWATRRGFDSLAQMSTGIAHRGMEVYDNDHPTPLPVQALDHATGYLIAAAVVRALRGGPSRARLSLARTAALLAEGGPGNPAASINEPPRGTIERNAWGTLYRLPAPVAIGDVAMRWDRPACALGSHAPTWVQPGFRVSSQAPASAWERNQTT